LDTTNKLFDNELYLMTRWKSPAQTIGAENCYSK